MKETRTIKVWAATYRRLKVLAALSGETLVELVNRLAIQEEQKTATSQGKEKV